VLPACAQGHYDSLTLHTSTQSKLLTLSKNQGAALYRDALECLVIRKLCPAEVKIAGVC
jgi:hypothetical protein